MHSQQFSTAAQKWLDSKIDLEPSTLSNYRQCLKILNGFFGHYELSAIDGDLIRTYQMARTQGNGMQRAARGRCNVETCVVRQVLKRFRVWRQIEDDYKDLRLQGHGPGRALTHEEIRRLRCIAGARPEWKTVDLALRIALNSTMPRCEISNLKLGDVNLSAGTLDIQVAKNRYRKRKMQMNNELRTVIVEAIEVARLRSASESGHYLFPRCVSPKRYDPTRPMVTWRNAWKNITHLAGLDGVRFHDIRHTVISELLSDPQTPQEVAMAISGHNTVAQLRHYNHVRQEQMFGALCRLEQRRVEAILPPRPSPPPSTDSATALPLTATQQLPMRGTWTFWTPVS